MRHAHVAHVHACRCSGSVGWLAGIWSLVNIGWPMCTLNPLS